jgi:hypothetical protein
MRTGTAFYIPLLVLGSVAFLLVLGLAGLALVERVDTRRLRRVVSRSGSRRITTRDLGRRRRRPGSPAWAGWLRPRRSARPSRDQRPAIDDSPDRCQALVRGCEDFIAGAYIDWADAGRGDVALAWLNLLTHAEPRQIECLANRSGRGRKPGSGGTWPEAASFLARELLCHSSSGPQLVELQRSILVPLELAVLDHFTTPPSPAALSRLILSRLAAHRSRS